MGAEERRAHGGAQAVEAARRHGVTTMFTLSGGHVFPLYDGAVTAVPPMPIIDVRHEQTAVFAAEATARLTRTPGLAVLTAGPGVTNGVSAVTTAHFNGTPLVVLAGRAPDGRWGAGSLQELDHPPLLAPVTKRAWTVHDPGGVGVATDEAFALASTPHRGPVFLDASLEALFGQPTGPVGGAPAAPEQAARDTPDAGAITAIARLLAASSRPVLVLGSDVWMDGAEHAARAAAERLQLPVITNGQGRGILPAGHPLLVTRARSAAFAEADLVIVAGTPLDFRLGYGNFGGRHGAPPASVVHLGDAADQIATHCELAESAAGDLTAIFAGIAAEAAASGWQQEWLPRLQAVCAQQVAADAALLHSDASPIHPLRIYGELAGLLQPDAVVIGDGGDFVSYAGKYVEPQQPGGWLDPGPYGCLGTGLGYAIAARVARPASQVVLLLGDGAAGFSLMDADTLVRHGLPVVMVCGNNGIWGLEKHPMQALYGYDVAADLQPGCRYDQVVTALGGRGELVTDPDGIGPALRRAFDSGQPYIVNVVTDPKNVYPRSTTGV
ncbi:MAG TPA: acetolactate synthase [Streptosporangiaceae bacterium]|nr:acetolactate synthase [Streptosporangiaceae bacterium]